MVLQLHLNTFPRCFCDVPSKMHESKGFGFGLSLYSSLHAFIEDRQCGLNLQIFTISIPVDSLDQVA